jgi:mitochondrial import receptor subunit TOM40
VSLLLSLLLAANERITATHLSTYIFDGARADITKTFSMNPLFQATHSFALGSQTAPPSYNFTAIYATPSVCVSSCSASA